MVGRVITPIPHAPIGGPPSNGPQVSEALLAFTGIRFVFIYPLRGEKHPYRRRRFFMPPPSIASPQNSPPHLRSRGDPGGEGRFNTD